MAKPKKLSDQIMCRVPLELWPLLQANAAKYGRTVGDHVGQRLTEALELQASKSGPIPQPIESTECQHGPEHPKTKDPENGYVVCECGATYAAGMGWNYDLKAEPRPAVATQWPITP